MSERQSVLGKRYIYNKNKSSIYLNTCAGAGAGALEVGYCIKALYLVFSLWTDNEGVP